MRSNRLRWMGVTIAMMIAVVFVGHHSVALAGSGGNVHGGYDGSIGPEYWGNLDERFAICSQGKNQSPINITKAVDAELTAIRFNYGEAATEILNNGHTIQVNYAPGGTMTIGGQTFELKQYHFHAPSENKIDGASYAMEAHFVHADKDGRLAVIAVMFKKGKAHPVIEKLWKSMPEKAGKRIPLNQRVDPLRLFPKVDEYYRFNGSLTTPPCTEGVLWVVMAEASTVSQEQVDAFLHVMHGPNNRPVQPVNARLIVEFD